MHWLDRWGYWLLPSQKGAACIFLCKGVFPSSYRAPQFINSMKGCLVISSELPTGKRKEFIAMLWPMLAPNPPGWFASPSLKRFLPSLGDSRLHRRSHKRRTRRCHIRMQGPVQFSIAPTPVRDRNFRKELSMIHQRIGQIAIHILTRPIPPQHLLVQSRLVGPSVGFLDGLIVEPQRVLVYQMTELMQH